MAATGPQITENELTQIVAAFYGRVRRDPELGPIFVEDWDEPSPDAGPLLVLGDADKRPAQGQSGGGAHEARPSQLSRTARLERAGLRRLYSGS